MLSLCASAASADPPRPDALKMRNAPRASSALSVPTHTEAASPALAPSGQEQTAPAAAADSAAASKAVKEASDTLALCYALARRADASLAAQLTVHATVRADASVELRVQAGAVGNGYFARCVERKIGALVVVRQLPEAPADARTIVLGEKPASH